ncbi:MAG: hypothetical protein LBD45_01590 [Bacteroidales bacterium]|jgi:hypothetical protein|nr:hypothetical protein [Bacteroidales bacterium]
MENNYGHQVPLTNATLTLVLGILSIPFCCCYGIVGLILAIIALVMASSAGKEYAANPDHYTLASYKNLSAGKICAIIGIVLSLLYFIFLIIALAMFGIGAVTDPTLMQEQMQELFGYQ